MQNKNISIITWQDRYAEAFKTLNLEWLTKYVKVEPRDVETMEHPYEVILNRGGMIWFALCEGKAVGTVSLIPEAEDEWELAKMSVTEDFKGKGIGHLLMDAALDFAKAKALPKIIIFTNSVLTSAVHLYHSYGFKEVPVTGAAYETSDLKMELIL